MANIIYLTLSGNKQGLISSGCSTYESIGNSYQKNQEDKILIYSFDHNISRNKNVCHNPIVIAKPIDKSTPLLGVSISENEELNCCFEFYRTTKSGGMENYYTVKIRKASIIDISPHYPNSLNHNDAQPYEMVSFIYNDITWDHHTAKTTGYSCWQDRIL